MKVVSNVNTGMGKYEMIALQMCHIPRLFPNFITKYLRVLTVDLLVLKRTSFFVWLTIRPRRDALLELIEFLSFVNIRKVSSR